MTAPIVHWVVGAEAFIATEKAKQRPEGCLGAIRRFAAHDLIRAHHEFTGFIDRRPALNGLFDQAFARPVQSGLS